MRAYSLLGSLCAIAAMSAPASAADTKPQKEKRICRSETGTGSILPKVTCHTVSEWKQIEQLREDGVRGTLDRERSAMPSVPR